MNHRNLLLMGSRSFLRVSWDSGLLGDADGPAVKYEVKTV